MFGVITSLEFEPITGQNRRLIEQRLAKLSFNEAIPAGVTDVDVTCRDHLFEPIYARDYVRYLQVGSKFPPLTRKMFLYKFLRTRDP